MNIHKSCFSKSEFTFLKHMHSHSNAASCAKLRLSIRNAINKLDAGNILKFDSETASLLTSKFKCAKDVNYCSSIVVSSQISSIISRSKSCTRTVNCQILAGPSGMGKSIISTVVSLFEYSQGSTVIFVNDAGELVNSAFTNSPISTVTYSILKNLIEIFINLNCDLIDYESWTTILDELEFSRNPWAAFLNFYGSTKDPIIVLDEHGHAFNKCMGDSSICDPKLVCSIVSDVFPLLNPNFYINFPSIRSLFSGSNQGIFEVTLNGSYRPCLEFIQPLKIEEARELIKILSVEDPNQYNHSIETYIQFTNCVPFEIKCLHSNRSCFTYLASRVSSMEKYLKIHGGTAEFYKCLFKRSLSGGYDAPMLDSGCIYRQLVDGVSLCFPTCYPAALAMIKTWNSVDPSSIDSWHAIKVTQKDAELGFSLEDLVMKLFLQRGLTFNGSIYLSGTSVGVHYSNVSIKNFALKVSNYYLLPSDLLDFKKNHPLIKEKIAMLRNLINDSDKYILVRFPPGFNEFDFVFIGRAADITIQVSISQLTKHGNPCLSEWSTYLGLVIDAHLYITTEHTFNPSIDWSLVDKIQVVDFETFLSGQSVSKQVDASGDLLFQFYDSDSPTPYLKLNNK